MQRNRSRSVRVFAALVVGALALAACGGGDDDAASGDTKATTSTREEVTTTTGAPVIAPLTGLVDPTGTSVGRGPMWVKIDNVNLAKRPPQAGIDVADVVYEEPVESATRFLALFHSTLPPRIGPVRSTRFIDPGIVWRVGGLYVFSGGAADKLAAIRSAPVQTVDENGMQASDSRMRDGNIEAPHNLFVVPETLSAWDQVQDRTPPDPLFTFLGDGEGFAGDAASVVDIPTISKARYTWNATDGNWKREALTGGSSGPVPHVAESGEQIAPTNIIVQRISGVGDKSVLVGQGDAWVCSQGRCTTGTWSRADLDSNTVFKDANGAEISLTPGTTWIHFITSGAPTITP